MPGLCITFTIPVRPKCVCGTGPRFDKATGNLRINNTNVEDVYTKAIN